MKKIKAAILGCSGLVGRQFVCLLESHPWFEISCLTASPHTVGKPYAETIEPDSLSGLRKRTARLRVQKTASETIIRSGARVVFSALPNKAAAELETELRAAGLAVFSNASSLRLDARVPLLIPEVNAEHLDLVKEQLREFPGFVVTNSNCSVSGMAMVLKPLTAFDLRAVTVTTFQAVSGAGRHGISAWDILGNVVPFIANEEEKIINETRKILGTLTGGRIRNAELKIYPSCSRVPVKEGHLQSVTVEFPRPVSEEEIADRWSRFAGEPQRLALPTAPRRPIVVQRMPDRPQPALDVWAGEPAGAQGMAVTVGRIRCHGSRCSFFLLVHNTRRGAAGGCVLNAELALKKGLLGGE